jgi:hypothetical protein
MILRRSSADNLGGDAEDVGGKVVFCDGDAEGVNSL